MEKIKIIFNLIVLNVNKVIGPMYLRKEKDPGRCPATSYTKLSKCI